MGKDRYSVVGSFAQVDISTGSLADIHVGMLPRVCHTGQLTPLNRPGHKGQLLVVSALGRIQIFDALQYRNVAQLQVTLFSTVTRQSVCMLPGS